MHMCKKAIEEGFGFNVQKHAYQYPLKSDLKSKWQCAWENHNDDPGSDCLAFPDKRVQHTRALHQKHQIYV